VIDLARMRLFHYTLAPTGSGVVTTHPLGIGREFRLPAAGETRVVRKRTDPEWIPPPSIRADRAAEGETLPPRIPPGPDNPLGSHALYLGIPALLIHGTHRPWGIGMRVSGGCLRLYPEDIASLYARVPVGTPVRIVRQPFVVGRSGDGLYLQVSPGFPEDETTDGSLLNDVIRAVATQRRRHEEVHPDEVSRRRREGSAPPGHQATTSAGAMSSASSAVAAPLKQLAAPRGWDRPPPVADLRATAARSGARTPRCRTSLVRPPP
jgi:hypothetical protein